jgi:hypothetical protein
MIAMTDATTASPPKLQSALSTALQTILSDASADEKAALKPVLGALFTGMMNNPDTIGWVALGNQFLTGVIAAQVTVKGQLLPQIAAIGQALIASW